MLSIIIPILNSHEIVRRQIEHFRKMELPDDAEFIFVDDGSDPPLGMTQETDRDNLKNLHWQYTMDKRSWTQGLARNHGSLCANGEYFLFTDIDHILTKEAIIASLLFKGDKLVFPRYWGILDEDGNIISDKDSLLNFGLDPARLKGRRGRELCAGIHGNTYTIRKQIFEAIGGYDRRLCEQGFHMGGKFMSEERRFNNKYDNLVRRGMATDALIGPKIYTYPVSKFRADRNNNPFGLFHGLSLEQPNVARGT